MAKKDNKKDDGGIPMIYRITGIIMMMMIFILLMIMLAVTGKFK